MLYYCVATVFTRFTGITCYLCAESMVRQIHVEEFLRERNGTAILDVRSPAEFMHGHIPGASNLPLFSDEERVIVGSAYKQVSPGHAMQLGLEITGRKLADLVIRAQNYAEERPVVVHCWRGGNRSGSISWLLNFTGMDVSVLEGGYKAYRTFQRHWFDATPYNLIILGGKTGSGKTEILKRMAERGEQVLDLEHLAKHKGSAFGWIGEEEQPSTEHFENSVFDTMHGLDLNKPIWVENESRTIGRVFIPERFWLKMIYAPLVHIEIPLQARIQNLVDVYAASDAREALAESFMKIRKRLGGQHVKAAIDALSKGDYHTAAEIALRYYDKTYSYGLEHSNATSVEKICADNMDVDHIADMLVSFAQLRTDQVAV